MENEVKEISQKVKHNNKIGDSDHILNLYTDQSPHTRRWINLTTTLWGRCYIIIFKMENRKGKKIKESVWET